MIRLRVGPRVAARLVLLGLVVAAGSALLPRATDAQSKVDFTLTLVPSTNPVEIQAGKNSRLTLEVRNTGNTELFGVDITSGAPEGWIVGLDPSRIPSIAAGSALWVNVSIRPSPTVTKGEYQVTLIATGGGVQRMQFLDVRVKPASYWMWVVFGVAAIVIAVFVVVFLRAGRRG